jgi:isoleucyl-tRNA synthetase
MCLHSMPRGCLHSYRWHLKFHRNTATVKVFLIAADLVEEVCSIMGCTVVQTVVVQPDDVMASMYTAPWQPDAATPSATQPILSADYVTADSGTGVVHTAPAHGLEDFRTCEQSKLPMGDVRCSSLSSSQPP